MIFFGTNEALKNWQIKVQKITYFLDGIYLKKNQVRVSNFKTSINKNKYNSPPPPMFTEK